MPALLIGLAAGVILSRSPALDTMNDRAASTLASTASGRLGTGLPAGVVVRSAVRQGVDLDLGALYWDERVTSEDRFGQGIESEASLQSAQLAPTLAVALLPRVRFGRAGAQGAGKRAGVTLSMLATAGVGWQKHGNRLLAPLERTHVEYGYETWQGLGGGGLRLGAALGQKILVELDAVAQVLVPLSARSKVVAAVVDGQDRTAEPGVLGVGRLANARWRQGLLRLNLLYRP